MVRFTTPVVRTVASIEFPSSRAMVTLDTVSPFSTFMISDHSHILCACQVILLDH